MNLYRLETSKLDGFTQKVGRYQQVGGVKV